MHVRKFGLTSNLLKFKMWSVVAGEVNIYKISPVEAEAISKEGRGRSVLL